MTEKEFMKKQVMNKVKTQKLTAYMRDLKAEFPIDANAERLLDCCLDRVSSRLVGEMKAGLRGYSEQMQMEIADDLLDYVCGVSIHTTGIKQVDHMLWYFYRKIQQELEN